MNQSLDTTERASDLNPSGVARASSSDSADSASPVQRKPRVLIVDDEENILASLRRLLRREPYELVSASSAQEALRVMESGPVQLIITDYRMPGMTGTELLHEVQRRWPDTLRIVLSGYSEVKAIISAINEGAIYKFISKPWNDEEIKLNVRRALEQYALQVENERMAREIAQQNERLRELNAVLDQRAADASAGLSSIQDLQEAIAVGVITFDQSGLIVGANRLASEMVTPEAGLFGVPAREALPNAMYQAFFPECEAGRRPICRSDATAGRLEYAGRSLQWRLQCVGDESNLRGRVATIWENVQ